MCACRWILDAMDGAGTVCCFPTAQANTQAPMTTKHHHSSWFRFFNFSNSLQPSTLRCFHLMRWKIWKFHSRFTRGRPRARVCFGILKVKTSAGRKNAYEMCEALTFWAMDRPRMGTYERIPWKSTHRHQIVESMLPHVASANQMIPLFGQFGQLTSNASCEFTVLLLGR